MINGDANAHLPDLSDDLIIIILSKLPLENLYCTCSLVSKSWRRDLVRLATVKREAEMADFALIGFWLNNHLYFRNACLIIPGNSNFHRRDRVSMKIRLPRNDSWNLVLADACNGFLLLFNNSEWNDEIDQMRSFYYDVCNPLTGRTQELPSLNYKNEMVDCKVLFSMLVFDPTISPHYKVLAFFKIDKQTMSACVFSSDQTGWRPLEHTTTRIDIDRVGFQTTICINGHAYRLGMIYELRQGDYLREVISRHLVLLKFNVEGESFKLVSTPTSDNASKIVYGFDRTHSNIKVGLGKAKGCLLYVAQVQSEVNMWILENDEWMAWRKMKLDELVKSLDPRSTLYPAAWDEHNQAFYCSAGEKLYCYSLKRSTKLNAAVVCDWNQLLHWRDLDIVPILCCVHDPTINPVPSEYY